MKKIIAIIALAIGLCISASAQRASVPYVSLGAVYSMVDNNVGAGLAVGFRNYNRSKFLSVGLGAEAYTYYIPAVKGVGAFVNPEIGLAIGPKGFKLYPHTGAMVGWDNITNSFAWGGKEGLALDFGKNFTLDFSTYVPKFNFVSPTFAINLTWRFGK